MMRAMDTMRAPPEREVTSAAADASRAALLQVVADTLRDLHAGAPGLPTARLDSVLDRDLGFDSLARMELLLRIERRFGVALPEDTLQRADTVGDLWAAVQRAGVAAGDAGSAAAARSALQGPAAAADPGAALPATPSAATTLLEVLDWHLQAHPDQTQVIHLADDIETAISYRALAEAAAAVAAGLQRAGLQPRQSVAIMLPTSPEYFGVYLGILRAGGVPVPIYPPARASQLEDHVLRHTGILGNAQAVLLVTVDEARVVGRLLQARVPGLRHLLTPRELMSGGPGGGTPVAVQGDDIAFIQYTSGSTGNPKGVALTHANLLANIRAMAAAIDATPRDVFVSWLPLYHDMGLIGAWLGSLTVGFPLVVMSPLAFLARPQRWLQTVTRYRGTLTAGPNFAYELCLKRIDDATLATLDLRSLRWAFNGAEAVSPDTVLRFQQRFAACGLRPEAVAPVYGLAEASVGLLFPPAGRGPLIDRIEREPLAREHRALPAAVDDASALRFVACGRPLAGHRIRIVDDEGREVGERTEGRLEFQGPSATHGYFRNPQQTARLFDDGWLDTGDRAYLVDGEVFVTGRVKDIVIRGGRNLYPQEIEEAVGAVAGVRKGCVAVFGSADTASGTERLVVVAEVAPRGAPDRDALRDAVGRAVVAAIGEPADQIVLAPPHTVLKTSSGKVRRSACRALFEQGGIGAAPVAARAQVLRLALGAVGLRLRQMARATAAALFGARAMLAFWLLAPATWLLVAAMPGTAAAWAVARGAARLLFRLAGIPLAVRGLQHLPAAGPCVLVSNHASYLDGVILVAALPRPVAFVAKRELAVQFVAGLFLRRLGAVFVERFERQRSVQDAQQLAEVVQGGRALHVFPEGTFSARPGLLPFHLGGFLAAAQARAPVLPVTIHGHREVLPDGVWWPRHAALAVDIDASIAPAADLDLFAAAVRLREAARVRIARRLEPLRADEAGAAPG
jgi:1-acyl-sn-glycerol-3-phosphate acyltransferase